MKADSTPSGLLILSSSGLLIHTEREGFYHLSRFLRDFVNWNTGRPIACQDRAKEDEWSSFIWAMLLDIKNKPFTRSRVGFPKGAGQRMPSALRDIFFVQQNMPSGKIEDILLRSNSGDERGLGLLFIDMEVETAGDPL